MKRRATAASLLISATLAGCATSPPGPPGSDGIAATLWSDRTPFAGDNSKVAALVSHAGFGPGGTYTIELQTDHPPYGVTVRLHSLAKPFDSTDFNSQATLLLGLVANLDHVAVRMDAHVYNLTAAVASRHLGYDVKDLGRRKDKLIAYLKTQQD